MPRLDQRAALSFPTQGSLRPAGRSRVPRVKFGRIQDPAPKHLTGYKTGAVAGDRSASDRLRRGWGAPIMRAPWQTSYSWGPLRSRSLRWRPCWGRGYAVPGVYCQPDRPAGRGRRLAAPPVKQWAQGRRPESPPARFAARRGRAERARGPKTGRYSGGGIWKAAPRVCSEDPKKGSAQPASVAAPEISRGFSGPGSDSGRR